MEFVSLNAEQRELVENSMPLVKWTIQHYISVHESVVGLEYDDLCQEGAVALCNAAATYVPGKASFKTYAITVIRNHLIGYCRGIAAEVKNLPTGPLEEHENARPPGESCTVEDEDIARLCAAEILERRKSAYDGCARLGIEALELKVLNGCGVTEIARRYHTKPNLVGAWISRASKKLREDITTGDLESIGVEKYPESA